MSSKVYLQSLSFPKLPSRIQFLLRRVNILLAHTGPNLESDVTHHHVEKREPDYPQRQQPSQSVNLTTSPSIFEDPGNAERWGSSLRLRSSTPAESRLNHHRPFSSSIMSSKNTTPQYRFAPRSTTRPRIISLHC
ncbi:cbl-interacting protein kinase 2 [Phtheirospermum japonicum]|uniref:Cbl-interacting protein kinase 2 n=1 Tax=Phtheirospermum japonicum TaxID=374723 RepID=A0A830DEK7_9LAMI|nr:cbl-interacting protein kinase 2 [Phtheirospermum japonicum]